MRYVFSEDRYGIVVTFNNLVIKDGVETIPIYVEQMRIGDPREPFNYAEGSLPSGTFTSTYGFSPSELDELQTYILSNADIIYDYAREQAGTSA
ncbi:MAG: hypothetical protein LBK67_07215 [Coriobacteriales bacterium]|jgi:hypothetical protein|nr:hypothetical protein [Coriobacteriales bacterium]